ncbi:hypothetical protein [Pseudomonas sp. SDO5591_S426]
MHRIDGPGATVDNKFTDGDPVGGIQATLVTDDWLTDIQENVMAVVEAGPITPTKGRAADLLDAIRKIISAQAGHGQCRLKFVSATSLRLDPFGGRNIIIGGVPRQIPTAGITLSNSGLSANTNYFVYAYWTGSAIALEASTTGHSQDATTGIEIKTGDATRTFVGLLYANAVSQFADSPLTRHVASYFNRRSVVAAVFDSTARSFSNTGTSAEVSTALRVSFVTFGDEAVKLHATGQYSVGAGQSVTASAYVDAAPYGNTSGTFTQTSAAGSTFASTAGLTPAGANLSEGQHLATMYGSVTGSTGSLAITSMWADLRI